MAVCPRIEDGPLGLAVSTRFLYSDITNSVFVIDKSFAGSLPLFNQRRQAEDCKQRSHSGRDGVTFS